jgi:diguanylate cyclase
MTSSTSSGREKTEHALEIEFNGFNRTLADTEWLLLVLILIYMALPDEPVDRPLHILLAGALFAAFVVEFRYANLLSLPARWKFTIETAAMIALTAVAVWNTGRVDSPLLNLFLLVVIFSALTLGRLVTLLELGIITAFYLYGAYSMDGSSIFGYMVFSHLMLEFAPFVLVAYVTSLLAADIGFARAHVQRLADTDALTGLSNMRAFNQALARHNNRLRNQQDPMSVLMIDIDNLKIINDRHGHETGNVAIRTVAEAIKGSVRADDLVARYGGDEFVVLLPSAPESAAKRAGERILARITDQPVEAGHERLGISVSIGLASLPVTAGDVDDLLHFADKALYESKRGGRNRLSVYAADA